MNCDKCKTRPGPWGLYIHHECDAHKHDTFPEYIPGTFESRDRTADLINSRISGMSKGSIEEQL
jgi:hypothetical protein